MPIPGVEVDVIDEAAENAVPTATDPQFLITTDPNAPTVPTVFKRAKQAQEAFPTAAEMLKSTDALFGEGAQKVTVVGHTSSVDLAAALAKLPRDLGPGQVVAPAAVTTADIDVVADWVGDTKRVYFANGPAGATDAALVTLAGAVIALGHGRYTHLSADTAIIPGAGGVTRQVPFAVVQSGIVSYNDLKPGGGNPNVAAAGIPGDDGHNGVCRYAIGVTAERTDAARETLIDAQVNTAKSIGGPLRSYGYRTLADLDDLPQWWHMGGSRTVMDVVAHSQAESEAVVFGQIDGDQTLEDWWNTLLSKRLLELRRRGALFAKDKFGNKRKPFSVDTGPVVNPVSQLAEGIVKAEVKLYTSPHAEALTVEIANRQLA